MSVRSSLSVDWLLGVTLVAVTAWTSYSQSLYHLPRVREPITIDGPSDESAWRLIPPFPVTMYSPTSGGNPTERTEIRVAYDDDWLYVAARLYDSEPAGILSNGLVRDGAGPNDDGFAILLDTFNDKENALGFYTTPAGIRFDFAVYNDAQTSGPPPYNETWNTFWDVAVVKNEQGWFAEMRIPFSSLRFQSASGRVVMGLTTWRYVARKNEVVTFPPIPAKWEWSVIKPSLAQDVVLEGIRARNPIYLAPYVLGGVGHSSVLDYARDAYVRENHPTKNVGLDLKYALTSSLTLDLTLKTDFAQVEADDEQINLTRFSLFFPEKRLFFQERSSIFDVKTGGNSLLFYSRRIGLADTIAVPIYGGLRLIGRLADWDLGFLEMQTERTSFLHSENFGVMRLKKRILNENSYVGAMLTSRTGADYNYAYGVDGVLRVEDDDYCTFSWSHTFHRESIRERGFRLLSSGRVFAQWERRTNRGFGYMGSVTWSGPRYEPGAGFCDREDFLRVWDWVSYGWYPGEESPIENHRVVFGGWVFLRNSDRSVESLNVGPIWILNLRSGASAKIDVSWMREDLREDLEVSDEVKIPSGAYQFLSFRGEYHTPPGSRIRGSTVIEAGQFYDGSRFSLGVYPEWNVTSHLEVSPEYQINQVRLPERGDALDVHIARLRVRLFFNTELSASTFLQYNSLDHAVILNARLRYNPREGCDFYLVYNEQLNTARYRSHPILPVTNTRALLAKFSYTFQFFPG